MQDRDSADVPRAGAEQRAPGISPVRAFFLLGALAAVVPLGIFATREATPAEPPVAQRSPDFSLTDAEAIAEFERLKERLHASYRHRDVTFVETFAVPGSRFAARIESEIKTLLHDRVIDLTRTRSHSVSVLTNDPSRVEIEEVATELPHFKDERTGRNLTLASEPQRQTIIWTLQLSGTEWRFVNAVITAVEPARDRRRQ